VTDCHPALVTENNPFFLALRIVRICSHPEARETRFRELKSLLLASGYRPGCVDAAIKKSKVNSKNGRRWQEAKRNKVHYLP
jgi:hypothetical protein